MQDRGHSQSTQSQSTQSQSTQNEPTSSSSSRRRPRLSVSLTRHAINLLHHLRESEGSRSVSDVAERAIRAYPDRPVRMASRTLSLARTPASVQTTPEDGDAGSGGRRRPRLSLSLTRHAIQLLHRIRDSEGARSLSDVVERAVRAYPDRSERPSTSQTLSLARPPASVSGIR